MGELDLTRSAQGTQTKRSTMVYVFCGVQWEKTEAKEKEAVSVAKGLLLFEKVEDQIRKRFKSFPAM